MITIITRTNNRPNFFARCRASVTGQTNAPFHLVISDNMADTYPEGDKVVRLPISTQGRGTNQYFNWVREHIPDTHPWVMFLDDDDVLRWNTAVGLLETTPESDNDLLLWQVAFPDRLVPGDGFGQPPVPGNISGIGFCYHKRHWVDWPGVAFGDYMVISQLYMRLRPVWIDADLTGLQAGPGMGQCNDLKIENNGLRSTTP